MTDATLIASLTTAPSANGVELATLPDSVSWLEVRADLLGDIDADWLRNHFKGRLSYALRSTEEGGVCKDSVDRRQHRLARAARYYDGVELEDRDLSESLLAQVPVKKRFVSWHGRPSSLPNLKARFARLASVPASTYKLVTTETKISDELLSLTLLKSLSRSDTIAYSTGSLGFWSRLAALQLGAPAISGLVTKADSDPAEPTISKLIEDYGLPEVKPAKEIFGIMGNPIFHSLSPRLHNAAYRAMNYPALFVPWQVESFEEFWREIVQSGSLDALGFSVQGITVASPHKEIALVTAGIVSPMARCAESANILVRNNGSWQADTTDPEVIYLATRERSVKVRHKQAAVVGCGGAGRAIAAALLQSGAGVTLINRGAERGNHAAKLLGLRYIPLTDFNAAGYDIVVNATPVGRDDNQAPFDLKTLNDDAVVIDLVYGSRPTPLVDDSLAREQVVIDGRDVLLTQVLHQFRMMTGKEMPAGTAMQRLGRRALTRNDS